MEYRQLGRSDLKVSAIGLGAVTFSREIDEATAFTIIDHALDRGINLIDTAEAYNKGGSETVVGNWIKASGKRDQIVLATKLIPPLTAARIPEAAEASLRRLQTDHIDLYQMHHVERSTPWPEIWQAMEQLVREGKVLYVGSSNFAGLHIALGQFAAEKRNFLGLVAEQSLYNLNARMVELEVIPACREFGLGLIPWSPLSGGLLGGALQKAEAGRRADARTQATIDKKRPQLEAYEAFCRELGEAPAHVALAWLLHNPAVTAPIIGPRTLAQYEESLPAVDIQLSAETLAKLNEIWPGPGGEAPEAYAW